MGTIWAHEVDILRSWKLISAGDFHRVQTAHWHKLPYWVLLPVGLALIGSIGLTAALWGRWQGETQHGPARPRKHMDSFCSAGSSIASVVTFALFEAAATEKFRISGRVLGSSGKSVVYVALWQEDNFLKRPEQQVRVNPGAELVLHFEMPGALSPVTIKPRFDEVTALMVRHIANSDITLK